MHRDAHTDFADSPGLREEIECALEERLERQAIDADWPSLTGLFKYWRAHGCPRMDFRIAREAGPATLSETNRVARFVGFEADNDSAA
jgi:hypothetical protein